MIFLGEKHKAFLLDEYFNTHNLLLETYENKLKANKKIALDKEINHYNDICKYKFKLKDIKNVAKKYKLKLNGTKEVLMRRCYIYLYLSEKSIIIQKYIRGILQRRINKLKGVALFQRSLCNNNEDFLSFESISTIHPNQFFSFKDGDFIYGFDIISLNNLILKNKNNIFNPYNRNEIPKNIISDFQKLLKLNKKFKLNINVEIEKQELLSLDKQNEFKIIDFFHKIDNLGHCTNPKWLMDLNNIKLNSFIQNLNDIWFYRSEINYETKSKICPPVGNPFKYIQVSLCATRTKNLSNILLILNNFIHPESDRDSQSLGCYFILGALTLVSDDAANSLPWLYHAFH